MITIGARRSPLARAQADLVAAELARHGLETTYVPITTTGDTDPRRLTSIGGTGVFVAAVRERLLTGEVDLAVHSAKDLPTAPTDGLRIAAAPKRADPRDALIGADLDGLARLGREVRIGTGSPRRAVQLRSLAAGRDLPVQVVPIRGNVDTRLDLVRHGEVDAVVLAAAGLARLGRITIAGDAATWADGPDLPVRLLGLDAMLPAAAQGILAVETVEAPRAEVADACALLDDADTRAQLEAERSFLATIEAGCLAPVGVVACSPCGRGTSADLTMAAVIGRTAHDDVDMSETPHRLSRFEVSGSRGDAVAVGRRLAWLALGGPRDG